MAKQVISADTTWGVEQPKLVGNFDELYGSVYTHPASHSPAIITQDADNRFTTDAEKTAWDEKQAALVSAANIKTINGAPVLGSGNLVVTGTYTHPANHPPSIITQDAANRFVTDTLIALWNAKQAELVSATNIKTINNASVLGSGNLVVTGTGGAGGMTFDVSVYGATGDGIANDLAEIQDACNAAMSIVSDQAEVHVSEGVFNLGGGTLNLSGISITGPGQLFNGTIALGAGARATRCNSKQVMFTVVGNGVTLDGCNIGDWTQNWLAGIAITANISNLRIIRNHIHHIRQPAGYGASGPTSYGAGIKFYLASGGAWSDIYIADNEIDNINGPGGIWFGVDGTVKNVMIARNHIHDTACFGIIGYTIGYNESLVANNFVMADNTIENIGSIRDSGAGNGAGGIYMVLGGGHEIKVIGNIIRHVAEVGVEGQIGQIIDNYIEDTGAYQLHAPITDCAGMFTGLNNSLIKGNTVVRPGGQSAGGCFYLYTAAGINGLRFIGNIFDNGLIPWVASRAYKVADIVSKGTEWYVCITAGTSGSTGPSGTTGNITDGTVHWGWKKTIPTKAITINSSSGAMANNCLQHNTFIDFPTKLDIARSSGGCRIDHNSYHHVYNSHSTWLTQWGGTSGTNYQYTPYVDNFG